MAPAILLQPNDDKLHPSDDQRHLHRAAIEKKYEQERESQLEQRGKVPYVHLTTSPPFDKLARDPWIKDYAATAATAATNTNPVPQGRVQVLILGAGFGGLLFAVRLIQSGTCTAEDILLLDTAAGFGGTWYWNRYPGLTCDVESSIYMPLLEETGYRPSMRYASGKEIREYAQLIAEKWGLRGRALFCTSLQHLQWNEQEATWSASVVRTEDPPATETIKAEMVILASGPFSGPQAPEFDGVDRYQGDMFHTARWNYECTGGSPEDPELSKLKNKTVGIIGTGATAVQVIPHLAKWAKELYVFQRTPSAVDRRDNVSTDDQWWENITRTAGWQRRRMENFNALTSDEMPMPSENLVNDGWAQMPSFSLVAGGPQNSLPGYKADISKVDFERQERIRNRVSETVHDETTAEILKPWYQGWCKRPCFHDEYLDAFNRPNVKLVDLRAGGVSHFTEKGVVVGSTEHELDTIILSTGFSLDRHSPSARANITVIGRDGVSMDEKWYTQMATLHGVVSRNFPNLFYPGPNQAGACANQMYVLDQLSTHVAYIISRAFRDTQNGRKERKVIVEPTAEAEDAWAQRIIAQIGAFEGRQICTPGYYNADGALVKQNFSYETIIRFARLGIWGEGIASYVTCIEAWRKQGDLKGLDLRYV